MSHAGTLLGLIDRPPCKWCGHSRSDHESSTPGFEGVATFCHHMGKPLCACGQYAPPPPEKVSGK